MRLIDAEKMKTKIHLENMEAMEAGIKAWIDRQETVDAVEVVRCKDCIYYGVHTNYIKGKFCIKHSDLNDDFVFHCGEDDYCIWGVRRENGKVD